MEQVVGGAASNFRHVSLFQAVVGNHGSPENVDLHTAAP